MKKNKLMKKFALLAAAFLMVQTPLAPSISASAASIEWAVGDITHATYTIMPHDSLLVEKLLSSTGFVKVTFDSISGGTVVVNLKNSNGKYVDGTGNVAYNSKVKSYTLSTDNKQVFAYLTNLESYSITVTLTIKNNVSK